MGWNGMKYSLVSRDWIADCVELMAEAYAVVNMQVNITKVMNDTSTLLLIHEYTCTQSFVCKVCVFLN